MHDRQFRDTAYIFYLLGEPREAFRGQAAVHHHPPGEDELVGLVGFEDFAVDGDFRCGVAHCDAVRLHFLRREQTVRADPVEVVVWAAPVAVAFGPFPLGYCVPYRLGVALM